MAFVGHAPSDFGGDLARKPCFMGKSFSKSLCHGVDIIGYRKNLRLRIRDARCGAGESPLCGAPGTDCETGAEELSASIGKIQAGRKSNSVWLIVRK